ncbi:MAG TPA: hypothetical protein V6D46_11120 [Coleofasciculaceae cyanobacterium]
MKFRPARQQPARSETEPALHRRLSLALECVELDLEAELARYRRLRGPRQGIVRRFFLKPPEQPGEPPILASAEALEASGALALLPGQDNSDLAASLTKQRRLASPRLLTAAEELGEDASLAAKSVVQAAMLLEEAHPSDLGGNGWERRRIRRRQDPTWTGVGVATILVMLSGTIWTYYSNYPDSDRWLKVGGLLERTGRAIGLDRPAPQAAAPIVASQPEPEPIPLPSAPPGVVTDLTRDEFADLSLENLAVLRDRPPASSATIGATAVRPSIAPQAAPSPLPFPQAQRAPNPAAAPAAPTAPNSTDSRWYVVAPYSGPASLIAARKRVADAYVRELPIGRRIQFGALPTAQQANQLMQQLKAAGISASLYQVPGARPAATSKPKPSPTASPTATRSPQARRSPAAQPSPRPTRSPQGN